MELFSAGSVPALTTGSHRTCLFLSVAMQAPSTRLWFKGAPGSHHARHRIGSELKAGEESEAFQAILKLSLLAPRGKKQAAHLTDLPSRAGRKSVEWP